MALAEYFESQKVPNEEEAIKQFFEQNVIPYENRRVEWNNPECVPLYFTRQEWRVDRYFTFPVHNVLKAYSPQLEQIYANYGSYSGKKGNNRNHMLVNDFLEIMVDKANFTNDLLTEKEIQVQFYIGLELQANEVEQDRYMVASVNDFLEAMCRCIDIASYPSFENYEDESSDATGVQA